LRRARRMVCTFNLVHAALRNELPLLRVSALDAWTTSNKRT